MPLSLRGALTDLSAERARPAADRSIDPRALRDRAHFLDEVNARMKSVRGTDREDVRIAAQLLELQDMQARRTLVDSSVRPEFGPNGISLRVRLDKPLPAEIVDPAVVAGDPRAPLYVEDSRGLNSVDWSAPRQQTVYQVPGGDLYAFVKIARADMAHFRPAKLDASVTHLDPGTAGHTPSVPKNFYRTTTQSDDDDDDDDEYALFDAAGAATRDPDYIYVLMRREASAQP